MNKMNWKWTLVCAAALVAATVLLDAVAWAGTPAVRYKSVSIGTQPVILYDMNISGAVVGRFTNTDPPRACLATIDATAGTAQICDLNTLPSPWVDLLTEAPATGWQATIAAGINDDGWIAGRAIDTNNGSWRAFLDPPDAAGVWTFYLLPHVPTLAPGMTASDVNNFGEVVGLCWVGDGIGTGARPVFTWNASSGAHDAGFSVKLNVLGGPIVSDTGIVIGDNSSSDFDRGLLRYDPTSDTLDTMIGISSYHGCLNCFGTIAGDRTAGRKSTDVEIIRFSQPSLADVKVIEGKKAHSRLLKRSTTPGMFSYSKVVDVRKTRVYSLLLYQDRLASALNIGAFTDKPLNYAGEEAEMSDANSTNTDPQATGFGLIAIGGVRPVVLIPQKP